MTVPSFLTINMSASWEAEKQSSHVVTRYCNFKIVQLILDANIDNDPNLNTIFIAVRMSNSSRKILRSSEISLSTTDNRQKTLKYFINIDLNCNIIYSHSLKRDCNILQILIQRKKRYKNKTVLGYKSLGYCNIDLNQVLQRNFDNRFLDLYSDIKNCDRLVGQVEIQHLSSVPYNKITKKKRKTSNIIMTESSLDDLEENQEQLSDESESEEDQNISETHGRNKNNLIHVVANRQKQLKQKLLGWVKKVKSLEINEELGVVVDRNDLLKKFDELTMSDEEYGIEEEDSSSEDEDIDLDFFNRSNITRKQLKNLLYGRGDNQSPTNSTLSLESTPRPILRPYLGPKNSLHHNITNSSDDTLSADSGARLLKRFFDSELNSSNANVHGSLLDCGNNNDNDFMKCSNNSRMSFDSTLNQNDTENAIPPQPIKKSQPLRNETSAMITSNSNVTPKSPQNLLNNLSKSNKKKLSHFHDNYVSSDTNSDETKDVQKSTMSEHTDDVNAKLGAQKLVKDLSGSFSRVKYSSSTNLKKYRSLRSKDPSSVNATTEKSPGHHRYPFFTHANSINSSSNSSNCHLPHQRDEINVYPSTLFSKPFPIPKLSNELNKETISNTNEFIDKASTIPDEIFIISDIEESGQKLYKLAQSAELYEAKLPCFPIGSLSDANYVIGHLVNRLQQTKLRMSCQPIKICILGNDLILHTVLRAYVNQLSGKPSEFSALFRFYLVPIAFLDSSVENFHLTVNDELLEEIHSQLLLPDNLSNKPVLYPNAYYWSELQGDETSTLKYFHDINAELNSMACHLCRVDPVYSMIFSEYLIPQEYHQTGIKDHRPFHINSLNFLDRITLYLNHSKYLLNLSIGECLIGVGDKSVSYSAVSQGLQKPPLANSNHQSSTGTSSLSSKSGNDLNLVNSHVCVEKETPADMLIPFLLHVSLGSDPVSALLSNHLPALSKSTEISNTTVSNDNEANRTIAANNTIPFQHHTSTSFKQQKMVANPTTSYVTTQTGHNSTSIQGLPIIDSAPLSGRSEDSLKCLLFDIQLDYIFSMDQNNNNYCQNNSNNNTGTNKSSNHGSQSHSSSSNTKKSVYKCCTRGLKIISESLINSLRYSLFYDGYVPDISPINTRHPLIQGISSKSNTNQQNLVVAMANKEKKQIISLLNKKSKDSSEYRHEFMANINRLTCSGRRHQTLSHSSSITMTPLSLVSSFNDDSQQNSKLDLGKKDSSNDFSKSNVIPNSGILATNCNSPNNNYLVINIDGVEWSNVKFFQIGPSWRTHIKHFPLSTFVQGISFPVEISRKIKSTCSQNVHKPNQNLSFSKKIHDSPKIHH